MRKALGLFAVVALLGAPAFAGGGKDKHEGTGGAGMEGKAYKEKKGTGGAGMQGQQELKGQVLKTEGNTVYLEHMGAAVPLKIEKDTRFEGIQSKRELKQGQEIRAQFTVENQKENVASRITVQTGTGGAGFEEEGYGEEPSGLPPANEEPIIEEYPAPMPEGTGGSGTEPDPAQDQGALYETGDVSGQNPNTVPEAEEEKGPAAPLPE